MKKFGPALLITKPSQQPKNTQTVSQHTPAISVPAHHLVVVNFRQDLTQRAARAVRERENLTPHLG